MGVPLPLRGLLAVIHVCLQRTRQRFESLKETFFAIERRSRFLLVTSLWFVYQTAAYPFSEPWGQLLRDCLSSDVLEHVDLEMSSPTSGEHRRPHCVAQGTGNSGRAFFLYGFHSA